jgi:uncharacterized protein (TIGR03067 family)
MPLLRLLTVALVCALATAAADDKPAKLDPKKLLGKWDDISGVKGGEKADPDRLKGQFVTVTKDIFKIEGEKPEQTFEFAYTLNADKSPAEIDLEIQFPEDLKGNKARGIIALDGKTLKLCYHPDDVGRPMKFESTAENGFFLWTMKRAGK